MSQKPDNRGGASWFVLLAVEKNEQINDLFQPLSSETIVSSVSPLYCSRHPVRLRDTAGGEDWKWCFSFGIRIALCTSPLFVWLRHTPQCYGARQGRSVIPGLLLSLFFNPSVLRTPPLYFAVHNTGEEDCNAVFFPILFCSAP